MFNWLFKRQKRQYFFDMLKQCLSNTDLNLGNNNLDELVTALFPKKERDLNVNHAISNKYPLNAAAMLYYAQSARLRCIDEESGKVDIPRYGNMIQGMITYLVGCKHGAILRKVLNTQIIDEFKDDFKLIVIEQQSIQQ